MLIIGGVIVSKQAVALKARWLRSSLRQQCLLFKYFILPKYLGYTPKVDVYVALNDPHSYMLIQALVELEQRYTVKFCLYLVYESKVSLSVEPHIWRKWTITDANIIAEQYGFSKVSTIPKSDALFTGQQLWQMQCKDISDAAAIFHQTWHNEFERYYDVSTPVINFQIKNQQRLFDQGHYVSASMQFLGEWFVGVDRLNHLEKRLNDKGFAKKSSQEIKYQANLLKFNSVETTEDSQPVEMYFSLRSPYSFVGFYKVKRLCDYYQVPLVLRPVLPLIMRNIPVSSRKQKHIYIDAYREAKSVDIPFSSFNDPIGLGVVKCFQVFAYAQHQGKSALFIEAVFNAIYVNDIDVAVTKNLDAICQSIDMDYQSALTFGKEHDWQQWADENQMFLNENGLWGVPCFRYGSRMYWGQDRLSEIEKALHR